MRVTAEDLAILRRMERANSPGPRVSSEEISEQVNRFLAAGGKIQQIPTGQSGEVFKMKRSTAPGDQHIWAKVPIKAG